MTTTSPRLTPSSARIFLASLVVVAMLVGCGAAPLEGETAAQVAVEPLGPKKVAALQKVQDRVESMLVVEVLRPAGIEPERQALDETRQRLRVGLMLVDLVSADPEHHYESARTLGTIYATGTSLGWPGAAQLSEYFLQLAVEHDPRGTEAWESLGMLHLMTGDLGGAIHYLETARSLEPGSPSVLLALGQAYHLDGRQEASEDVLGEVIEAQPGARLPRAVLDLVRMAVAVDGPVFRAPASLQAEPFRPASTMSALAMPLHVEYRNVAHGFSLQVPWNWTLHEEETDLELDTVCRRLAFASWDLPLDVRGDESALSRVRVIAFPLDEETTAASMLESPPIFVQLPAAPTPVDPLLTGATQGHWEHTTPSGRERVGDVVFVTHETMGFVLQYVATVEEYERGKAGFEALVTSFEALRPGRWAPSDCLEEQPI